MITVLKVIEDYPKQSKNIALLGHSGIAYLFNKFDPSVKERRFNKCSDYILGVDSSTSSTKVTAKEVAEWIEQGHSVRWTLSNTNLKGKLDIHT